MNKNTEHNLKRSRYTVLAVLMAAYVVSVVDRGIISVVMSDLQREFLFTDTQLALLGGTAFALFYATLGIPVARLADRWNRCYIVVASIAIFSVATALSGLAVGFWSLFICRLMVGVGESGCTPASHSLIADFFERRELGRALGLYSIGGLLGILTGHLLGSFLAASLGWRTTFIAFGLSGVVFALLSLRILFDPRNDSTGASDNKVRETVSLGRVMGSLLNNKPFLGVLFGHGMALVCFYTMFVWLYPLVERSFDLRKTQIGQLAALALMFGAIPGMYLGGMLSDHLSRRTYKWMAWLAAGWTLISIPLFYSTLLAMDYRLFFLLFGLFAFCLNMHHAAAYSIVQLVVLDGERATAVALVLLVSNLLGYALAPVLVGYLSDTVFVSMGNLSLRYGLGVIGVVSLGGVWMFLYSAKHIIGSSTSKSQ